MSGVISSRQNPAVTHITKLLTQAKYRRETGEFAAEGDKLYRDALDAGVQVTAVLYADGANRVIPDGVASFVLTASLFEQISTHKTPQGVLFTAKRPVFTEPPRGGRIVVLDGVQDPGNVGTVLRTAAAFGMEGVVLTGGCADPYSHKTVRASMGGVFRVPVFEMPPERLATIAVGKQFVYASPSGGQPVQQMDWSGCIPIIGSEGQGISETVSAMCSGSFTIPMHGSAESLNAAVAAALIMWEMCK